jgi:hypothetical protein
MSFDILDQFAALFRFPELDCCALSGEEAEKLADGRVGGFLTPPVLPANDPSNQILILTSTFFKSRLLSGWPFFQPSLPQEQRNA